MHTLVRKEKGQTSNVRAQEQQHENVSCNIRVALEKPTNMICTSDSFSERVSGSFHAGDSTVECRNHAKNNTTFVCFNPAQVGVGVCVFLRSALPWYNSYFPCNEQSPCSYEQTSTQYRRGIVRDA